MFLRRLIFVRAAAPETDCPCKSSVNPGIRQCLQEPQQRREEHHGIIRNLNRSVLTDVNISLNSSKII